MRSVAFVVRINSQLRPSQLKQQQQTKLLYYALCNATDSLTRDYYYYYLVCCITNTNTHGADDENVSCMLVT